MSTLDPAGKMSADDRFELAVKAQSQQRLNYPKHLLMLGFVFVFVALVTLVIGWQVRAKAYDLNQREASDLARIEALIGEITALQVAQENSSEQDQFQPIPDMLSRLKRFAQEAKLNNELGLPIKPQSRPEGNARLMTYPYSLRDPSLEHLLDWIQISIEQIPGLAVTDLVIKPANEEWNLTVTLSRYERIE